MVLVSVSIKICIWQKDRTQLNQFSRYTLYTYNIFTSLRLSSLYTSCPRTIQSWTALTWRCLEERNGSISRRSGAPAYRAMFRQLATKLSLYPWKSQKSTYLQTIRPPLSFSRGPSLSNDTHSIHTRLRPGSVATSPMCPSQPTCHILFQAATS